MFDNKFETVVGTGGDLDDDDVVEEICNRLFETDHDWFIEEEYDNDRELVYQPPPLEDGWLDEPSRRERKEHLARQRERAAQR